MSEVRTIANCCWSDLKIFVSRILEDNNLKDKTKRDKAEIAYLTKQMNSAATKERYYNEIAERLIKLSVEYEIPIGEIYSTVDGDHFLDNHVDRCHRRYMADK